MRILALVFTTAEAPAVPQLDDAWDASRAAINRDGFHEAFADLVTTSGVEAVGVVPIEIPDEQLLRHLHPPALHGTVASTNNLTAMGRAAERPEVIN